MIPTQTTQKLHVAILGFGREGQSVFTFLKKQPFFKNWRITVCDTDTRVNVPRGATAQLGRNYLRHLERFDLIFRSPGVPYELPELKRARKKGVVFSGATKLFFERCPATIIGITGTKGKGTTATLLYKILHAAGKDAYLAGNIGLPPLEILSRLTKKSVVVLELSSFQLQDLEASPQIAVVLDVFPDHQDSHRNLREYYTAKANIAKYQHPVDKIFFFPANKMSAWIASKSRGKKYPVTERGFRLFGLEDLKTKGLHNLRNAVMAAAVAHTLGVPQRTITQVTRAFRGLEHRLEFVRRIGQIYFYNDSASTNPHTAAAALLAFPSRMKILIAGGQDKNLNYRPLAQTLKKLKKEVALVILVGENKKKIENAIRAFGVPIKLVSNLKTAVRIAYWSAKKLSASGYSLLAVILSPGATSFDQFENYADRGKQFKKLLRRLKSR